MGLDNPLHIAFLVVILLLVFGARRLPEIGRSLGSGMREFKQSITGEGGSANQPALGAGSQQPASSQPAQMQQAAPVAPPAPAPVAAPAPEQAAVAPQPASEHAPVE
jgi:sec-independent protein translocase protein TatA